MTEDIRCKQRFNRYLKALQTRTEAVQLASQRPLPTLEQPGLIQEGQGSSSDSAFCAVKPKSVVKLPGCQSVGCCRAALRPAGPTLRCAPVT